MFGRRFRMRSPKNVVDELEHLHNTFGADKFTFYDDAFTVDQSRVEEICREIHNRKLKITWDCGKIKKEVEVQASAYFILDIPRIHCIIISELLRKRVGGKNHICLSSLITFGM